MYTQNKLNMTREELIDLLYELMELDDIEDAHIKADRALLDFIDDGDIEHVYSQITKWYG